MRRRELITILGGATIWPLMASAQRLAGTPHVIYLAPVDIPSQTDGTRRLVSQLGYVEGSNIRLEFRNAAGNVDALPALAEELVREGGVDVIVAISTPAALAAYLKHGRTINVGTEKGRPLDIPEPIEVQLK